MTTKLLRQARALLKSTGVPYAIVAGKRHYRIDINGKPVTILPFGATGDGGRSWANFTATVRKAARESTPG